ncbi:lipoprotein-releasing system permease protein [Flavobacterium croceum DSM 17960]|uniref:Lipoprotein-releasing system permease protein n=1 Tax=Flavobacterium croceum DSM 17960 TaxID=1121886 RepID=A0A2S4NBJ6_9FLAO|nr:FtsX-like permease family protein [Flavobacterium croceum]POS03071.1 lipoprotein-releasing system permease protein [Flavobacterium croceum DSM 17960]
MNFSYYIAKRYLKSKSSNNAINIITLIASVGIVVGAAALFVVLSVFSGLREFSLSFSNDYDPDYKIVPKTGKIISCSVAQEQQLKTIAGYKNHSKVVEERVLFYCNEKEHVAYLKGVDSLYNLCYPIQSKIHSGQWLENQTSQAVVGYGIAYKMSLGIMDTNNPLEVFVPKPGKGSIADNIEGAFNKSYLFPVGIYAINEELDSKYVYCDLATAQELLSYSNNKISAIEIKSNAQNEQNFIASLQNIFGNTIEVKTRAQLNETLYRMLNTENFVLYLIFTLVFIMILFAFVGSVIMIIIDKRENLKTLFFIGAEIKSIKKIFLIYGTSICVIGGIVGIILGGIIVYAQQKYQWIMITESLPYPVVFSIQNIVIVLVTIVSLGFIASYISSNTVSKKLLK